MRPTYDQLAAALGPLLNDKVLHRVRSHLEAVEVGSDPADRWLAVGLRMLLLNHEKRAAALKSLAAAKAPANQGGDHEVAAPPAPSPMAGGSPSEDPPAAFNNGSR